MATSRQLREQIAAGRWDAALAALYGGSEKVLARQRSRYGAALEQFELYYGPGRQVQVYSAPGRTELGGNHTDHQHGYGLAGAVTLDLVAVASRNEDGFIRVKSRGFNKLDVIDLTEAEPQQGESTHSASLIRGIAEGFRAAGKTVGGFDAYTASDVLRGSGLSSSAAFEMGMAAVWNGEYGCGLAPAQLAKICQYAENTYFGKPSGLLDQLTSAVGGVIFADFADPQAPVIEKIHADGLLPPGMFLCVGVLYERVHSRQIADYGGVTNVMPLFAALAFLFAFGNFGVPGTAGFVGEWSVIIAAVKANFWVGLIAATSLILAAAYTLWMMQRVFLGPVGNDHVAALKEINVREIIFLGILGLSVLAMGVYPKPITRAMDASVNKLVQHVATSKIPN